MTQEQKSPITNVRNPGSSASSIVFELCFRLLRALLVTAKPGTPLGAVASPHSLPLFFRYVYRSHHLGPRLPVARCSISAMESMIHAAARISDSEAIRVVADDLRRELIHRGQIDDAHRPASNCKACGGTGYALAAFDPIARSSVPSYDPLRDAEYTMCPACLPDSRFATADELLNAEVSFVEWSTMSIGDGYSSDFTSVMLVKLPDNFRQVADVLRAVFSADHVVGELACARTHSDMPPWTPSQPSIVATLRSAVAEHSDTGIVPAGALSMAEDSDRVRCLRAMLRLPAASPAAPPSEPRAPELGIGAVAYARAFGPMNVSVGTRGFTISRGGANVVTAQLYVPVLTLKMVALSMAVARADVEHIAAEHSVLLLEEYRSTLAEWLAARAAASRQDATRLRDAARAAREASEKAQREYEIAVQLAGALGEAHSLVGTDASRKAITKG